MPKDKLKNIKDYITSLNKSELKELAEFVDFELELIKIKEFVKEG